MAFDFITSILIVLVAALVGRYLSNKFKQPVILGELILGAVVGNIILMMNDGAQIIEDVLNESVVKEIAYIGIFFLLFSAGLSINLKEFKKIEKSSSVVAILGVVFPFILGYITAIWFGLPQMTALFVGTALMATSIGVKAEVLLELGMMGTRLGSLIMGAAVIDDIISMIILTILISVVKTGYILVWEISFFIIIALIFILIGILLTKEKVSRVLDRYLIKVKLGRESLLIMGVVVALLFSLIAENIGLSLVIGAFIAGIILGQLSFFRELKNYVSLIGGGFFIPVFFVTVGMTFDFNAFLLMGGFAGALLVVAIVGKLVGCGLGAKLTNFDNRDSIATGVAMIPRAGIELILVKIGRDYGIIQPEIASAILIMVIITTLITPPVLVKVLKK
jgi:Kef-type K+ transport system membrane component KefB